MLRLSDFKAIEESEGSYLGYADPRYVNSLSQIGAPLRLPESGGWLLQRRIPGTNFTDAMGTYPYLVCSNWAAIPNDLHRLRETGLISAVIVTDPDLQAIPRAVIESVDHIRAFKHHYVFDLSRSPDEAVSRHHRYYVRKARKALSIDIASNPLQHRDEWRTLYQTLIERHRISDLRVFSEGSFSALLSLPGVVLFRALSGTDIVGAQIVIRQGDIVIAHLSAFSDEGYKLGASYLLDWTTLEHFRGQARQVNWGGVPGIKTAKTTGLVRYKQGWATAVRHTYVLGAIFNRRVYHAISRKHEGANEAYFPTYRAGEFG